MGYLRAIRHRLGVYDFVVTPDQGGLDVVCSRYSLSLEPVEMIMNFAKTPIKTRAVIVVVSLIILSGAFYFWLGQCGGSIGDEELARSILRPSQSGTHDIVTVRLEVPLKDKTHVFEWSEPAEIEEIFNQMKSRRGELLGNIKYTHGVALAFVSRDGRKCTLEFTDEDFGGVYFGDSCRSYEENGWLIPAADLYAWVIQTTIDSERAQRESASIVDD